MTDETSDLDRFRAMDQGALIDETMRLLGIIRLAQAVCGKNNCNCPGSGKVPDLARFRIWQGSGSGKVKVAIAHV